MNIEENERAWLQFPQYLKVSWMIFWRAFIIAPIFKLPSLAMFVFALIAGAVIVYGFGYSIRIWPLIKFLKFHNKTSFWGKYTVFPKLWVGFFTSEHLSTTTTKPKYSPQDVKPGAPAPAPGRSFREVYEPSKRNKGWCVSNDVYKDSPNVEKTANLGEMTSYIPRNLENVELAYSPRVHGTPGVGLDDSAFSDSNIKAGQEGELNFAKALQEEDLINDFESFWSVGLPDASLSRIDSTDIDAVLVDSENIFLIDLKNFKQGDLTYYNDGDIVFGVDNSNGDIVGIPHNVSPQMSRAADAFQGYINNNNLKKRVIPMVVLMPTNRGAGLVDCEWPGGIPAYSLKEALRNISKNKASAPTGTSKERFMFGRLTSLLK